MCYFGYMEFLFDKLGRYSCHDEEGFLHQDNGLPAYANSAGRIEWWVHGQLHREHDLPAFVSGSYRKWFYHGVIHRICGPAALRIASQWCLSDVSYFHE